MQLCFCIIIACKFKSKGDTGEVEGGTGGWVVLGVCGHPVEGIDRWGCQFPSVRPFLISFLSHFLLSLIFVPSKF